MSDVSDDEEEAPTSGPNAHLVQEITQLKETIASRRQTLKGKFSEEALTDYLKDTIAKLARLEGQLAAASN